jgi:hypothetical protein
MGGWGEAGSPTTSTRRVCSIYSRARGFTPRAGETLRRATRVFPRVEEAGRGARQEVRGKRVPPSPPPPPFAAVSLGCNNCAQELRASGGSNCYLRSKSRTGYAPRGPPAPPLPRFNPVHVVRPLVIIRFLSSEFDPRNTCAPCIAIVRGARNELNAAAR